MEQEKFYIGETIKLLTVVGGTVSSIAVTIKDPSLNIKVNEEEMSSEEEGIYSYLYQTAQGDGVGTYTARITATQGSNVSIQEKTFEVVQPA